MRENVKNVQFTPIITIFPKVVSFLRTPHEPFQDWSFILTLLLSPTKLYKMRDLPLLLPSLQK